jgi:asparagine synthase (glutamine-hydrolysing)
MCGIAGQSFFDGSTPEVGTIARMVDSIFHRGPDGRGVWGDQRTCLGHCRLAIRDLTPSGAQPFSDDSGNVVVSFNGEIYNDAELRAELENLLGYQFRTTCDTEVIPAGYLAWGEEVFNKLEGMFAIALWDVKKEVLYLARDGMGIKPLFYQYERQKITFASEIKAVLHGIERSPAINPRSLHTYLAQGYVGPSESLLEGISQVQPGSYLRVSRSGIETMRFWSPQRTGRLQDPSEAWSEFVPLFRQVCQDMLVSDVDLGVLQSGGIDSSLISLNLKDRQIALFTARFPEASFDETPFSKKVAMQVGSPYREINCSANGDAIEDFRSMVHHLDGQLADSSAFGVFRMCREVRKYVKVALSGDGADECFGGYPTYKATWLVGFSWPHSLFPLFRSLGQISLGLGARSAARYPFWQILGRFLLGAAYGPLAHTQWRRYLMAHDMKGLYGPLLAPLLDSDPLEDYAHALTDGSHLSLFDRCLLADQNYYLPADMLRKVDGMSMAHGLEVRVPFLDRRIVEFAGKLHPKLLGQGLSTPTKPFLRAMMKSLGGDKTVVQRPKAGFNIPINSLLTNQLSGLCMQAFEKNPDLFAPYLRSDEVRRLWRDHVSGMADHRYVLWSMLVFAVWQAEL